MADLSSSVLLLFFYSILLICNKTEFSHMFMTFDIYLELKKNLSYHLRFLSLLGSVVLTTLMFTLYEHSGG